MARLYFKYSPVQRLLKPGRTDKGIHLIFLFDGANRMKILGIIVIIVGIFLFCGNVFGFFPTFPLVGWGTIALGGFIMKQGESKSEPPA
ncbi:MAG: hypothetical protein KIT34_09785 [Cyanobacteria bacterium TGS_CYA1]|nr:hypothetical protein [Cyanobacteria bacterium TGS_CYA1]